MTLTVKLSDQEQARLEALILALHAGDQSKLVRQLINDRFVELQMEKTLVERRGGHPKHLLNGASDLSKRSTRKAVFAEKMQAKAIRRKVK